MATVLTPSTALRTLSLQPGWLMNLRFDMTFIIGVMVTALLIGGMIAVRPELFPLMLFLDVWLLAYHHITATFTRMAVDREEFLRNRFLLFGLPMIVFVIVAAIVQCGGAVVIASIYVVWQWWHYSRQSYGIARAYMHKGGAAADAQALSFAIYGLPILGILVWCARQQSTFLDLPIRLPSCPWEVIPGAALFACGTVLWWVASQIRAWLEGRISLALNLYLFSHFIIYTVSYFCFIKLEEGWLVINIWHNMQYILFVWYMNNKKFASKPSSAPSILEILCRCRLWNILGYHAAMLCLTIAVFYVVTLFLTSSFLAAIPAGMLIINMTINFHHYIVDAIIWKSRRKTIPEAPAAVRI